MGAGGAGACAGAAWKEEGSLASGWTHGLQTPSWSFLCSPEEGWGGPAFHDNFAHVLLAATLASAGKAACLLLAMPGKA